jgi:hypothetical protein
LPVVPIHDLIIKGTDMVVATHGRSFWILDDVTPLHQLPDQLDGGTAHLFRPRPAVRVRTNGGSWGDEREGYANYDRVATSIVPYLPVKKHGKWTKQYLGGGANPPGGAIIRYYLPEAAEHLMLDILDADDHIIRSVTRDDLPADAGVNTVVWDLRHHGATKLDADDLDVWQRETGPLVLPGLYTVRLHVGDHVLTQEMHVVHDPRITVSDRELRAQHDLLLRIRNRLSETNEAILRSRTVRAQAAGWQERFEATRDDAKSAAVIAAANDLTEQLAGIERELIDVQSKNPMLFPIALQEKFNALFDHVDSADAIPTQNANEVFSDLSQRLDEQLNRLRDVLSEEGSILNRAIAATDTPAVTLG